MIGSEDSDPHKAPPLPPLVPVVQPPAAQLPTSLFSQAATWTQLSIQLSSAQLSSTQLGSTQLDSTWLNSTRLNSAQPNSTHLGSTQLGSTPGAHAGTAGVTAGLRVRECANSTQPQVGATHNRSTLSGSTPKSAAGVGAAVTRIPQRTSATPLTTAAARPALQRWIATSGARSAPKRRRATCFRKNDGGSLWVLWGV